MITVTLQEEIDSRYIYSYEIDADAGIIPRIGEYVVFEHIIYTVVAVCHDIQRGIRFEQAGKIIIVLKRNDQNRRLRKIYLP